MISENALSVILISSFSFSALVFVTLEIIDKKKRKAQELKDWLEREDQRKNCVSSEGLKAEEVRHYMQYLKDNPPPEYPLYKL